MPALQIWPRTDGGGGGQAVKHLFVGGPWHGKMAEIDGFYHRPFFQVPVANQDSIEEAVYKQHRIKGEKREFVFYALAGMKFDFAFELILELAGQLRGGDKP